MLNGSATCDRGCGIPNVNIGTSGAEIGGEKKATEPCTPTLITPGT